MILFGIIIGLFIFPESNYLLSNLGRLVHIGIIEYEYDIRNDFDKIKSSDSQIVIDLDNKLNSLVVSTGCPV